MCNKYYGHIFIFVILSWCSFETKSLVFFYRKITCDFSSNHMWFYGQSHVNWSNSYRFGSMAAKFYYAITLWYGALFVASLLHDFGQMWERSKILNHLLEQCRGSIILSTHSSFSFSTYLISSTCKFYMLGSSKLFLFT